MNCASLVYSKRDESKFETKNLVISRQKGIGAFRMIKENNRSF